jgi:Ras-related protein Rab-11A
MDEEEESSYELLYKVIIIGDTAVGKSNILSRYVKDEFSSNSKSTVGVELGIKFLKIKNTKTKIQIWDTAGQERYRAITSSYFKGSNGCFIVYDITNEASFNNIENWYEQIQKETSSDLPILLVGNKCDLEDERKVPIEKGKEKAKNLNCAFFETSALKKINIDKIFEELVNNIYEKTGGNKNDDDINIELVKDDKGINLNDDKNDEKDSKKGGCCGK